MLGQKERIRVKWWEQEILTKVAQDRATLKSINPIYAKRILQIFSYPLNKGNESYVKKIIANSEELNMHIDHRSNLYTSGELHTGKVIRSAASMPNIAGIFITNPIREYLDPKTNKYQERVNRTNTKDIDGQSTKNKDRLKDFSQSLEWTIVHPTSLSVLSLLQKTLETTNLQGKKILFAGKDGNFWSMIATTLERAGATTIGFNPRKDDQNTRHEGIKKADAIVSVIRGANYFTKEYFEWFTGPIIDVTTENDGNGKTVWSVDRVSCQDIPNIYIPSINGGVGTITSARLMDNFSRCIINTEMAKWLHPEIFSGLQETRSYANFWLEKIKKVETEELAG